MKNRKLLAFTLILCVFLSCISIPNRSTVNAAGDINSTKKEIIQQAIEYLNSSKNVDNSIGYSNLINDTAEAVAILKRFSDTDVSENSTWISNYKKTNNDELARAVMATGDENDLQSIFKTQNTDGGFGLTAEYKSDVFDSVLVLEAINSLDQKDRSNETWRLVTYIARQMNKNGSFSYTKNSDENVALTAMSLYVVSKFMHDNNIKSDLTTDMIEKSSAFLKSKSENSFSKDKIEETLYVDLALQEAGLFELQESTINGLKNVQKEDGSFYGDVHLTSLAIWLLGKIENIKSVTVLDLKTTNTAQAYYGVETDINVTYSISYDAKIDKDYTIACVITNGNETIYESEKETVTLAKAQSVVNGSFKNVKINQDKDNGIIVTVTLYDEDQVIKKTIGSIKMENQPRAGETEITDFTLELSDYYTVTGAPIDVTATYKLLYTTNVNNSVDMHISLSKDGNILQEESYTESLVPESDNIHREALTFTPDVSKEGKYTVTLKCMHEGELVTENSVDFLVIAIPVKEEDEHTATDATKEHIPFTAKWIGPKLSDYMIYAGRKQVVTGDVGIICYGDDDFTGKVIAEVMFGEEQVSLAEKDVTILAGENNVIVPNMVNFEASELGEYIVTATLYDSENNKIISGTSTVKVVEKKRIDLIANSSISTTEKRTVDISWNDISDSKDTYNYRLYRRYDDHDWEPRSIWNEKDKVKVLNVYPNIPLLESWMTETISNTEDPAGMGMFIVDSVYIRTFNEKYNDYLKNENGTWKYDVIFFGSWDSNCYIDLTSDSYSEVQKFVDSGRGVLFGHDTVCVDTGMTNFLKFADQLGIKAVYSGGWNAGTSVSVVNIGTLTNFPWTLRGTLQIPATHSLGQYVGGNLAGMEWMSIDAYRKTDAETGGHSNSYLVSNNNLALIQTGHSNGQATDDERKVLANTLFYLHQISQVTTAKDNSFYDLAAPDTPDVDFVDVEDTTFTFDLASKDNGTTYQYYIDAISSTDSEDADIKSNILTHVALSGIKGYVYVVNNSPDEDISILEYDENNEHILNTVEPDKNGILNINIDTSQYDTTKDLYLHVFAVDNEDNVSGEVVKNLGEGKLSPHIETDKEEYYIGETVKVTSKTSVMPFSVNGDVSISLYDEKGKFIEELYGKNNQTVSVEEPYTTENEITLDDSFSGSYKLKIEWKASNNEVYSDTTEFKIGVPNNTEDENKKVIEPEDKHTETDATNGNNQTTEDNTPPNTTVASDTKENTKTPSSVTPGPDKSSVDQNEKPASDTSDDSNDESSDSSNTDKPSEDNSEEPTTDNSVTTTTTETTESNIPNDNNQKPNNVTNKTPRTGDEINLVMIFTLMGISAVIMIFIAKRKRDNKNA